MPSSAGGHVDALGQLGELRSGVDPDPEYSRSLGRREESVSANANFERAALYPPQTLVMASTCSGVCSPMNFNVMCSDSGRTQRASGAKP